MRAASILLCIALLLPQFATAQSCHDPSEPAAVAWVPIELLQRPIELRDGVGAVHDKVTTASPKAQALYDQGLAYLHSYVWIDAARSFQQALREDPKLAMAYVGLSRAYAGLYDIDAAKRMAATAAKFTDGISARERARVELQQLRAEAMADFKNVEKLTAYRSRLDQELTKHYDDVELWVLRGNVEDRWGALGIGQFGSAASIPFYEHVLTMNPDHFGAHHFLIHSFEHGNRIDDALKHGAKYAGYAPNVAHAHHMYGHDLRRVGRTKEAIEQFEIADRLELANFEREKMKPEMDWHHPHNLDLLAGSYQHEGQLRRAETLMKRSLALEPFRELTAIQKKEYASFLLARGRIDDAAAEAKKMTESKYPGARAMGHLYLGYVAVTRNDAPGAQKALASAEQELTKVEGQWSDFVRNYTVPYANKLRGGIALRSGERERGREILMKVEQGFRALPGPDAWMAALFELEAIGRLAREIGDWELVEFTAKQMLEHDAAYGGSHYLAALVAQKKGDATTAAHHLTEMRKNFSAADADLDEVRVALRGASSP